MEKQCCFLGVSFRPQKYQKKTNGTIIFFALRALLYRAEELTKEKSNLKKKIVNSFCNKKKLIVS